MKIQQKPGRTRGGSDAFSEAYERGLGEAWKRLDRGDWLMPLVYATRSNDKRLARALVHFARSRTREVRDADAAMAVLEVADATLTGDIDRDLCTRIAGNLLDEAYVQLTEDHRFDLYFTHQCASAAARVAAHVERQDSLGDALDVVRAAATLARLTSQGDPHSEQRARKAAADEIRSAVGVPTRLSGQARGSRRAPRDRRS